MSFEVVCDVEGCDERAPVGPQPSMLGAPTGWSILISSTSNEVSEMAAKRAMRKGPVGLAGMGMDLPFGPMPAKLKKTIICPKHPMPKFKPPAASDEDDFLG